MNTMNLLNKKYEYHFILLMFFFLIIWFKLFSISNLASPDYYKYFYISEHLFSGHLDLRNIPPLFPLLLGLSGRFLSIISGISDPFIVGTKIISLISSIGVITINFLFIKKLFNTIPAFLASVLLVSSPFFLKFAATPITDMLFLFLVCYSFYFMFLNKKRGSILLVLTAIMTRFEGVLLIGSYFINFIDLKIKKRINFLIYSLLSLAALTLFYLKFGMRFVKKIEYIISSGSYLNFIKHPERVYSLLMKNILFFYRGDIFGFKGGIIFLSLSALFLFGIKTLFRLNRKFTWALIFYMVVFTISKGYISGVGNVFNPESQARRMLSLIYLFWFVSMIGFLKLLEKLKKIKSEKNRLLISSVMFIGIILIVISLPLPDKKIIFLSVVLILLLIVIGSVRGRGFLQIKKIFSITIVFLLLLSIYDYGFNKTYNYVGSLPNRGAFVISQWADANLEAGEKLAVYSTIPMVKYYIKKDILMVKPYTKIEDIYRKRNLLASYIAKKIKINKIKYIATDVYMNMIDNPWLVAVKLMFFKSARRGSNIFKLHKRLFYKGLPVAVILKLK